MMIWSSVMQKWEYMTIKQHALGGVSPDKVQAELRVAGQMGWELVSAVAGSVATGFVTEILLFFKRPVDRPQ